MVLNLCMQLKLQLHLCCAEVNPEIWITWWHTLSWYFFQKSELQSLSTHLYPMGRILDTCQIPCSAGSSNDSNNSHKVLHFWLYLYSHSLRGRRKGFQNEQKGTKQNSWQGELWRILSWDCVSICRVVKQAAQVQAPRQSSGSLVKLQISATWFTAVFLLIASIILILSTLFKGIQPPERSRT